VEDWYHGEIISRRTTAEFRFPQVAEALTPVLDLLARENVQATFFVVGELLLHAALPHRRRRP
jgi:peptidoglycan/xylan/chitin deacetylase (PgdA/CDA1 family)